VVNFYEKAHSVQADAAAAIWCERQLLSALRAMLLSALSVSPLFDDSVHREIRLFELKALGAARFRVLAPLSVSARGTCPRNLG
jgi:hypothetical protein